MEADLSWMLRLAAGKTTLVCGGGEFWMVQLVFQWWDEQTPSAPLPLGLRPPPPPLLLLHNTTYSDTYMLFPKTRPPFKPPAGHFLFLDQDPFTPGSLQPH